MLSFLTIDMASKSKKGKQATLFKFHFKRTVKHKGNFVEVKGEDFVKEDEDHSTVCDVCRKGFKSRAGLTMHVTWCESSQKVGAEIGNHVLDSTLGIVTGVVKRLISTAVRKENKASDEIEKEATSVLEELLDIDVQILLKNF